MSLGFNADVHPVAGIVDALLSVVPDEREWVNPEEGPHNIDVGVSGRKFSWGDQPPYDRIDELREECISIGCTNLATLDVDTKLIIEDYDFVKDVTIKLTAEADFAEAVEQATMDDLFDLAMDVASGVGEVRRAVPGAVSGGSSGACAQWSFNCQNEIEEHDQYLTANEIIIQVRDKDTRAIIATLKITAEIEQEGNEACEDFLGAAGAVAGAFNGAAGGFFSLASMFCN